MTLDEETPTKNATVPERNVRAIAFDVNGTLVEILTEAKSAISTSA